MLEAQMSWPDLMAFVVPVVMGLCAGVTSFYVGRNRNWRWGLIAYGAGVLVGAVFAAITAIFLPERAAYVQFGIMTIFGGGMLVLVTSPIGAVAGLLIPSRRH
jgi:uncharacterized membrane protein YfcA